MATETRHQKWMLIWISVTAALGGFLFGYDTGVISGATLFIRKQFHTTTFQEELIISIVSFGAIFGALVAGPLSDKFGRKKIILGDGLLFIIGAFALAFAPSVNFLIYGRLLVGFAIGIAAMIAPLYIAELSPRNKRGALVTINQLAITVGILFAYFVGLIFSHSQNWNMMFGLACVPAGIQFVIMSFFPESPRWLLVNNQKEKALAILEKYRGSKDNARLELEHIEEVSREKSGSAKELFSKRVRPALIAGIGLTMIQQFTGINTIIYYAPTIFKYAGFTSDFTAILATLIVGVTNVGMTFVAIYLLDLVGRKPLLIVGLSGMVFSLILLGVGFMFVQNSPWMGWIALLSMMLYIAFFAFSLGPIGWLINSEIYPLKVRGRAMGIATCANWTANFIVTLTFLNLIHFLGTTGTFWLFALVGLFGLWFIIKKIPETKHKSLEEIDEFWTE